MNFEFSLTTQESTELIKLIDSEMSRKSSDATEKNAKSLIDLNNLKSKLIGINENTLYKKYNGRRYQIETLNNLSDFSHEKIDKLQNELTDNKSLSGDTTHDEILIDIFNKKIDQEDHINTVIKGILNSK